LQHLRNQEKMEQQAEAQPNSHEEGLEAKANCFINLKKSKTWPIIFIALSTKKWPMH